MKVYKDIFTGDELCSDSYDQLKPFDDESLFICAFEVKSKRIKKGNEDFGIAQNTDADDEGNGCNGGGGVVEESVIDLVDSFKLVETPFVKKDFMTYVKGYMMRIKGELQKSNPARVDQFMIEAPILVKKIINEYDEYTFFLGESMDAEAGVIMSRYVGEEDAPRFLYFRDGLKEEKY